MGNDIAYIYGQDNGSQFTEGNGVEPHTHWDPRIEVRAIAGTVQIGIVPPSHTDSTDEHGVWKNDDGQFLTLTRSGLQRLIAMTREARNEVFGKDE